MLYGLTTIKGGPDMNIKRDKRDAVFSQLTREGAGWTCDRCGKYHPEGFRQSLHCSHIYSRRNRMTRWMPLNAAAHCFACHNFLGENPLIFAEWAKGHLGKKNYEKLGRLVRTRAKLSKPDLEEIHTDLKREYDRMMALRMDGVEGRIAFDVPGPIKRLMGAA